MSREKNIILDNPNFHTLTEQEQTYARLIAPQSGVLCLWGRVGSAKSSMIRSITTKLNIDYHVVHLSSADEALVGGYPRVIEMNINGVVIPVMEYVIPLWAILANEKPTIVHYEEVNRCTQGTRNAAMQMLLDREIGPKFKFNKNVFMVASANASGDDAEVDEFGAAYKNRFIHRRHELSYANWHSQYTDIHFHPELNQFLKLNPDKIYITGIPDTDYAFATERTWTFLNDHLVTNYGFDSLQPHINSIRDVSANFVGSAAEQFNKYLLTLTDITLVDVANDYKKLLPQFKKHGKNLTAKINQQIRDTDLTMFTEKYQVTNIINYILDRQDEEIITLLLAVADNPHASASNLNFNPYVEIIKFFKYNPDPELSALYSAMSNISEADIYYEKN